MVHAHPPIISSTRIGAADWVSFVDSITSIMQLVTVFVMIRRIITQRTTEGQTLLPHILDGISSVVTLYLGLVSQMSPFTEFAVAAASLAVIVHFVYVIVYVWRTPHHRGRAVFYFIFAMLVVGAVIYTTQRFESGMGRVLLVTIISGVCSCALMVPALRDLYRALRHHEMDGLTAVDAGLALLNAVMVVVAGLLKNIVMYPHIFRGGLGILQIVVYRYTTIWAGPTEQDVEAQTEQGGGEVEMTELPPPSPTSSSMSPSSSPSSSTRSPPPPPLPVPQSPDYPQRVVQLQPPPEPPYTVIFALCVLVLAYIRYHLARIGLL